jgi:hypothetical protein
MENFPSENFSPIRYDLKCSVSKLMSVYGREIVRDQFRSRQHNCT